ncbi:MAG: HTH domain-containing protein [Cyclobacteriaceae bacterium]|nr:HTH domain-containing protein [Cyclobacteriaceae bacterium]
MQYEKYLLRIRYLRELVIKERTGPPKELARKLGISERMVYRYLQMLNEENPISYSRLKKSYIFSTLPQNGSDVL